MHARHVGVLSLVCMVYVPKKWPMISRQNKKQKKKEEGKKYENEKIYCIGYVGYYVGGNFLLLLFWEYREYPRKNQQYCTKQCHRN